MLVTILLSQGGHFTADIGDDDTTATECVSATRDLLEAGELLHGVWGSTDRYSEGPVVAAYLNLRFVAGITT